ncbi:iron-containing redox enzyme family protein [Candidatus Nitrospira allomarina]|jgi:heme oxygenase-like protein|uniref:Iron-containing redox enzyme family protein n=1 Tax=Candidatus Nitrospira allomarina TaxID=3020900 RepID=A0AA96GEI9_9BACT|nr:iron-containing redox enzyme family protein [Candidatus Nitrospira allomarina]WNM57244.1 iron-containing redox enzyme family protein [Candidatus Nitrospira allomarina]
MSVFSVQNISELEYCQAHEVLTHFIQQEDLDQYISLRPKCLNLFEQVLGQAMVEAYEDQPSSSTAHLFLQQILYRINRLKLFWYDDLENYTNEDSTFLLSIRRKIETAWQAWESQHIEVSLLKNLDIEAALRERAAEDLNPELSQSGIFYRNDMSKEGYRQLLAIASLDGLVEASQLSRVIGGVGNEIQSMLTKILFEEYGGAKLERKHTSFFSAMLIELGMDPTPETYFDIVPWEVLANINHSFTVSERKRFFLRYIGSLLYFEISVPAAFQHYKIAGERLGLSEKAIGYWDIHIKEDLRHGQWMLNEVALPLITRYQDSAWEIVMGYDQQRSLSTRAGLAIANSVLQAENA